MKKAALVIGVNKTGDLPVLRAAASSADEFATWAENSGFDLKLITDMHGKAVTLSEIKTAIKAFVDPPIYSQLIVHFSGHGLLRGDYEL
jgi:hypothetical protein